ncbi:MAG: hypothetical protein FOGNACKC_00800 [Anaerolineae bacterium]|nr:hypothetical protein [Anaerolineae bacterium]
MANYHQIYTETNRLYAPTKNLIERSPDEARQVWDWLDDKAQWLKDVQLTDANGETKTVCFHGNETFCTSRVLPKNTWEIESPAPDGGWQHHFVHTNQVVPDGDAATLTVAFADLVELPDSFFNERPNLRLVDWADKHIPHHFIA